MSKGALRCARLRACVMLATASVVTPLAQVAKPAWGLPSLDLPLQNRYILVRHGQSISNMEGVISSAPEVGTTKHGLTANGRVQARRAATRLIDLIGRDFLAAGGRVRVVASDFLRAVETADELRAAMAQILAFEDQVYSEDVSADEAALRDGDAALEGEGGLLAASVPSSTEINVAFRERFFGELDALPLPNYDNVWPKDLEDPSHEAFGVESVVAVATRVLGAIQAYEAEAAHAAREADCAGTCVVICSHADTLQITQSAVSGADIGRFSQYRFRNGEVREIFPTVDSLPDPVPLTFR